MRAGEERKDASERASEGKEELDGEGNKAGEINRKSAQRGRREKEPIIERGRVGGGVTGRSK